MEVVMWMDVVDVIVGLGVVVEDVLCGEYCFFYSIVLLYCIYSVGGVVGVICIYIFVYW